jgi:hypothetical protein
MPIRSATFYGEPGLYAIVDESLVGVEIIGVKREGIGFDPGIISTLDSRQYGHLSAYGWLVFANQFTGPTFGRPNRVLFERVWVLYKALI